jgi:tRNA(fMet)-specific endonuclease VapC
MLRFLLDTDHLTLLDHAHPLVMQHIAMQSSGDAGLPVVTVEEYVRGRLAALAQAKDGATRILRYSWFAETLELIQQYPIIRFDQTAEDQYQHLRVMRLRIGTRDQKIAAIALANKVTLVTRNQRDFGQVPGLILVDWSV